MTRGLNQKEKKEKEKGQIENLKKRLDYGKEVSRLKTRKGDLG